MRTLYQTLEQLALELPYGDDISQITRTLALIYHDEILYLPWRDRHAALVKLGEPRAPQRLIALVLRELQRHAQTILQGHGIFDLEDKGSLRAPPLSTEHVGIVQRLWDSLGKAPAWLAFESQIDKLASSYQEES